jgi:hypothetical protein
LAFFLAAGAPPWSAIVPVNDWWLGVESELGIGSGFWADFGQSHWPISFTLQKVEVARDVSYLLLAGLGGLLHVVIVSNYFIIFNLFACTR